MFLKATSLIQADYVRVFLFVVTVKSFGQFMFSVFVQLATVMLLISGALVNGPYALITTAVSADLVSLSSPLLPP